MTPLHGLCLALIAPPLLAGLYYWALAVVALGRRPRPTISINPPRSRFAVVIPAHNEAAGIGATLQSCRALDWPTELIRVIVVADNCTDDTATIALRAGAEVLERHDLTLRGKGHALAWALPRVLAGGAEAIVLLDADCTMDRHALRAFAARLAAGQRVLQARVAIANPDASPVSYAAAVGNLLENDLFYAPKDRLGGAVFLRGTGMALAADVLAEHPWAAYSLAEDSEYSHTLLRAGVQVRWAGEVTIRSDAPTDVSQLRVQRRRWAAALNDRRTNLPSSRDRWRRMDARVTRLVMSRPLILGVTVLAAGVAGLCYWWQPDPLTATLATAGVATLGLQALYLLLGVVLLGVTPRRLRLLACTPLVVVRLLGIAVRGAAGAGPRAWVRTPRIADPPAEKAA
jgi:glycosyltransferase involved in cell wall biosynthesis